MTTMTISETAAWLRERDTFLILTHRRPDGDTAGSAAALCDGLRALGKTAYVLENPDLTRDMASYLPPYYAPADYAPQCVITTDVASPGLLTENARAYENAIDLAIDHHPSHEGFARDGVCLYSDYAATGEIIYDILMAMDAPVSQTAATALYCAVSTDTGCFVYDNTSPHTHRVAAALMDLGCDYKTVNKRHFRTKSRKRIALESAVLSQAEFLDGGRIVVITITQDVLKQYQAAPEDTDSISSLGGAIEGVDCALTLQELKDGKSKISLRTGARVNASRVCQMLGGGGHAQAAGATLNCPLAQARTLVLDAIEQAASDGNHRV